VGLPEGLDEVIHAYAAEPELVVDEWLRVAGFETVFAAGDAARMAPPAARSGAVAVRQGRVLGENLRRMAEGRGLAPFAARGPGLAILGLDERRAVGWFRGVVVEGRWVMGAKKWLDGRWVRTAK
jgi:NADH dehydrogenase FAD-containing subunit